MKIGEFPLQLRPSLSHFLLLSYSGQVRHTWSAFLDRFFCESKLLKVTISLYNLLCMLPEFVSLVNSSPPGAETKK